MDAVEAQGMLDGFSRMREGMSDDLEELRDAIKVIERQARRLEKEIGRYDAIIRNLEVGEFPYRVELMPAREPFADMSIPDAAAQVIRGRGRPLHASELADILEAGGKRLRATRPTVSIASALSRDARFVRVGPNTFDLVERTQPRLPIEE